MNGSPASLSTTDDAFLGGRLSVLQPQNGYRAGLDAVLLAASSSVPADSDSRVLDAGAGVGVVGLAIAARTPRARVTMVEIDAELAALARLNAARNGLESAIEVIVADIAQGGALFHDPSRPLGLRPGAFTHLVSNPPYYASGSGTAPFAARKRVAHQMAPQSLDRWLAFLATAAATDALLTLVHRADALDQILSALSGRFGRIRIRPVFSRADAPAGRVLVSAVKGSRAPLALLPGLILMDSEGRYRPEIEDVLRQGAVLPF